MPIFLKSCFLLVLKIWSLLELWLTSYTRLCLMSPYGDFGPDRERVNSSIDSFNKKFDIILKFSTSHRPSPIIYDRRLNLYGLVR